MFFFLNLRLKISLPCSLFIFVKSIIVRLKILPGPLKVHELPIARLLFQNGWNCTSRGRHYDYSFADNIVKTMLVKHTLQAAGGVKLKQATYSMLNN